MQKLIIALTAALLASSASAATLIDHANGVQADAAGHIQHFTGIIVGDDGKIVRLLHPGEARPKEFATKADTGLTLAVWKKAKK